MAEPYLIVGLGNPEPRYELTRHNLGFLVADHLTESHKLDVSRPPGVNGALAEGTIGGAACLVLKPLTYVNRSGVALKQILAAREIVLENILVVCDDLNLDFGRFRLRRKGSDGGHNGLASIIRQVGSEEFTRLRIGIGTPADKREAVDYVLERFTPAEEGRLEDIVGRAAECCEAWVRDGVQKAMSQFNQRNE